jgi:hypothetical protein
MPRSSSPTTGWYGQLRNSLICNVGFLPIPVVMVRRDATASIAGHSIRRMPGC